MRQPLCYKEARQLRKVKPKFQKGLGSNCAANNLTLTFLDPRQPPGTTGCLLGQSVVSARASRRGGRQKYWPRARELLQTSDTVLTCAQLSNFRDCQILSKNTTPFSLNVLFFFLKALIFCCNISELGFCILWYRHHPPSALLYSQLNKVQLNDLCVFITCKLGTQWNGRLFLLKW